MRKCVRENFFTIKVDRAKSNYAGKISESERRKKCVWKWRQEKALATNHPDERVYDISGSQRRSRDIL